MFTMMNEARLKVGLQGLAIGERAYQQARDFAKTRIQGRPPGVKHGERVTIIQHPDVRRMLLNMKAQNEAMRALCYSTARDMDLARHHPHADVRKTCQSRVDLLIPIVKGWCTELGNEIAYTGVQVHGGMGFIEETGAAQHLRDARILPIYEGTNGIQANDLVGRKLMQDQGKAMSELLAAMQQTVTRLAQSADDDLSVIETALADAIQNLEQATRWLLGAVPGETNAALAGAMHYLMLCGYVIGGWHMAQAALIARDRLSAGDNSGFYDAKLITARFYAEQILPKAGSLLMAVKNGGHSLMKLAEEQF
jgi:acyl-CoA dehydrogenase